MNRIMVIGQPAAGKSTFARALGAITGLPVHHMDQIYWMPGWTERPRDEALALVRAVHASDAWIFEGNNTSTWPERVDRADTIIWLDLPLWQRYWRMVRRVLGSYGKTRPDMAPDAQSGSAWSLWSISGVRAARGGVRLKRFLTGCLHRRRWSTCAPKLR